MNDEQLFTKTRVVATIATQQVLAPEWVWSEHTLAEWEADLAEFYAKNEAASDAGAGENLARGEYEVPLDALRQKTVDFLTMARTRWRQDRVRSRVVKGLSAKADSRTEIMEQALIWEKAWGALEPAWEPRPGQTLAVFRAERLALAGLNEAFRAAQIAKRLAEAELAVKSEDVADLAQAWYADAAVTFPADTGNGQLVRKVPTK